MGISNSTVLRKIFMAIKEDLFYYIIAGMDWFNTLNAYYRLFLIANLTTFFGIDTEHLLSRLCEYWLEDESSTRFGDKRSNKEDFRWSITVSCYLTRGLEIKNSEEALCYSFVKTIELDYSTYINDQTSSRNQSTIAKKSSQLKQ